METTEFNVPSISCSTCSSKIQNGIKDLKGIGNVSVDLKSQLVKVEYNPGDITPADIRKQVSMLGYEVVR